MDIEPDHPLLKDFPLPFKPSTWELNDLLLDVALRQEEEWHRRGYRWTWGMEFEFETRAPAVYKDNLEKSFPGADDEAILALAPHLAPSHKILNAVRNQDEGVYELKRQACLRDMLSYCRHILHDEGMTRSEKRQAERRISWLTKALTLNPTPSDVVLAVLHTYPLCRGGVADIIEPRYDSRTRGKGWYDGKEVPEIRSLVNRDLKTAIVDFHHITAAIVAVCEDLGVIPYFSPDSAHHLNFGIETLQGCSVLDLDNPTFEPMRFSVMRGVCHAMRNAPIAFGATNLLRNFSSGSSRGHIIRQKKDHWEVRGTSENGQMHMAALAGILMSGAAASCFSPDKRHMKSVHAARIPVISGGLPSRDFLRATLARLPVSTDGRVKADPFVISYNLEGLQESFGSQSWHPSKSKRNLDTQEKWEMFFGSLRITPEGCVDDRLLPKSLQGQFRNIHVAGYKTIPAFDVQSATGPKLHNEKYCSSALAFLSLPPEDIKKISYHFARQADEPVANMKELVQTVILRSAKQAAAGGEPDFSGIAYSSILGFIHMPAFAKHALEKNITLPFLEEIKRLSTLASRLAAAEMERLGSSPSANLSIAALQAFQECLEPPLFFNASAYAAPACEKLKKVWDYARTLDKKEFYMETALKIWMTWYCLENIACGRGSLLDMADNIESLKHEFKGELVKKLSPETDDERDKIIILFECIDLWSQATIDLFRHQRVSEINSGRSFSHQLGIMKATV